jgi:outer membrane protein OmpA-like peptidoglycan-associated protein
MAWRRTLEGDDDSNFWPVYADLAMVMLLIFFLFMMAQLVINKLLELENPAIKEMRHLQDEIYQNFQGQKGVFPQPPDGAKQAFIFSADVLFAPDDATLKEEGKQLMTRFGKAIFKYSPYYDRIEVEGHADTSPSQLFYRRNVDLATDHGNWRLSSERAITVVQLFQELAAAGDYKIGQQLAVVGRSFYDPADPNDLAQNRRIVIRLYYSEVKINNKLQMSHGDFSKNAP